MNEATKRRSGRPSKGKRGTFTFRVTGRLRDHLEQAAAEGGRSVSEQIELFLEQVLLQDRLVGDRDAAELLRLLLASMEMVKTWTNHHWNADERSRRALECCFSYLTKWKLAERSELTDNAQPSYRKLVEQRITVETGGGNVVLGDLLLNTLDHPEEVGVYIGRLLTFSSPLTLSEGLIENVRPLFKKYTRGAKGRRK